MGEVDGMGFGQSFLLLLGCLCAMAAIGLGVIAFVGAAHG